MKWLFNHLWNPARKHAWLRPFVVWLGRRTGQKVPTGTRYRTVAQLKRAAKKVKVPPSLGERLRRYKELDRRFHLLNDAELAEHYKLNLELGNEGKLQR